MFGIDTSRVYFREEIAEMWGYEVAKRGGDNLNQWWRRNFSSRGLKTFRLANRELVHGRILAAWIEVNSDLPGDLR